MTLEHRTEQSTSWTKAWKNNCSFISGRNSKNKSKGRLVYPMMEFYIQSAFELRIESYQNHFERFRIVSLKIFSKKKTILKHSCRRK